MKQQLPASSPSFLVCVTPAIHTSDTTLTVTSHTSLPFLSLPLSLSPSQFHRHAFPFLSPFSPFIARRLGFWPSCRLFGRASIPSHFLVDFFLAPTPSVEIPSFSPPIPRHIDHCHSLQYLIEPASPVLFVALLLSRSLRKLVLAQLALNYFDLSSFTFSPPPCLTHDSFESSQVGSQRKTSSPKDWFFLLEIARYVKGHLQ